MRSNHPQHLISRNHSPSRTVMRQTIVLLPLFCCLSLQFHLCPFDNSCIIIVLRQWCSPFQMSFLSFHLNAMTINVSTVSPRGTTKLLTSSPPRQWAHQPHTMAAAGVPMASPIALPSAHASQTHVTLPCNGMPPSLWRSQGTYAPR